MAKIKLLSARSINTLPEGFHSDGGNLFLRVRGDSRNWIFRYKKLGKQIVLGLGATHARPLQEARELAESNLIFAMTYALFYCRKNWHTKPTIFSLSFGELSAIKRVIAVNACGVILLVFRVFVSFKNQINA